MHNKSPGWQGSPLLPQYADLPETMLIELKCVVCGSAFRRTKHALRNITGLTCSRPCATTKSNKERGPIKIRTDKSGPKNNNWKGGISKDWYRYKLRFVAKFPEKARVHQIVRKARVAGKLIPEACRSCGTKNRVHAHHEDYSKPLEVIWFCQPCHNRHHAGERHAG